MPVVDVLAVRGTVLIGLVFAAAAAWPGVGGAPGGAGPRALVRVEGEVARPGWYAAGSVAEALAAAGAAPNVWMAEAPEDTGTVRVVGGFALTGAPPAPLTIREIGVDPRVCLNHADLAGLEALPRVGPVLAGRIVAARPFRSVADLDRVKGVGPATMRLLRGRVRL